MIAIDLLQNYQSAIPQLSKIWHNQLGKIWMPHLSIEYIKTLLGSWIHSTTLPLALVAFENEKPIGIASLQSECGLSSDLTPWLGSLVIDASHQKQGIGSLLVYAIKEKTRDLGYTNLYLFTFDTALIDYYHKLGFNVVGTDMFCKQPITIMMAIL